FVRMFGYRLEDIPTAREWFLRAYPDDDYRRSVMEAWGRQVRRVRAEGEDFAPFEAQVTCKDGTVRFVLLGATFLDEDLIVAFTDITNRKQAEEALQESETQYRTLIDNLNAGVIVHAPDTGVILNNAKAAFLLGLTADQMRPKAGVEVDWRFLHEDGTRIPPQEHPVARVVATNRPVVNEVIGVDNPGTGKRAWLLTTAYPEFDEANRLRQVVVTFLDITRRKEAETVLLETELRLRSVVGAAPLILWEVDRAGKVLLSVVRALAGLGLEPNQIVGQSVYEVYRDAPETNANIERCLAGEEFSTSVSVGGRLWSNHYTPVRDGSGSVSGVVGVSIDTTDRQLAETALRASEARFRALSETAPVGIFEADLDGRNTYMNPAGARIVGSSPDEVRGTGWQNAIHPEDRERLAREWGSAVSAGTVFTGGYRFLKPGAPLVTAQLYAAPVKDHAGRPTGFVGAMVDVTRQLELEKKLQQATRLAAMGTLVAGLAHEINNPLTAGISGQDVALEIARELRNQAREDGSGDADRRIRQLDEAIEALEDARQGGQRIAAIVRDMAALARPDPRGARGHLRSVVEEAMSILPTSIIRNATISVEDHGAPEVVAAAGQITQVVVNLITNAVRAMPQGKRAEIVVRVGAGESGQATLEVIDQGMGIAPDIMGRIFDPFFTTRPVGEGRGTGLGLSICHAIVTSHGGTLTVASEVGKGSTFRMELPAAPREA
ncbi:MAG: PAS domain S-box protein, partial [Deltaproteobacteria bacterium]